jgi:hypothetical protein
MSEGHHRPRSRRPRGGGVTGRQDGLSEKSGEQGLPRRLVVHRMGMRHGRLGDLAEATSPRIRPLRGPRCRKRRRFTSWHFLQSSRLLDVAAMLRRTGVIDGDASRGLPGQMPGIWCRCRRPANSDVRRPGASFGPALDGGRIGHRDRSVARMPQGWDATIPEGAGRAGYERQKIRRRRSHVPAT